MARLSVCIVSMESRRTVGGLAAYSRRLVEELRDQCDVSTVAVFDRPVPGPLDYAGDNNVHKQPHDPVDGIPTRFVRPAAGTRRLLRRLQHLTARPSLRSWAPTLYEAAYRTSVARAIPKHVDVVHYIGTGWELLGFAALAAARRRGAAFTVWPAVHAGTWGDSPLDIDLYNRADAVFCQSNYEMEHLAGLGVAPSRLVRAWLAPIAEPSGDGRAFRNRHGVGDRPLILFIARKLRSKGFHALCEAILAVLEKIPDACLVAIGPPGDPPYPPLPASAYLDVGIASESEKADALAACDVFCMPSAAESFGLVYVEAWSYGKAVIGGPAPAAVELLRDGQAGLAVTQQPASIADALIRLLSDTQLRNRLGEAGRQLVRDQYNWDVVRELHLDAFKQLIAARQHVRRRASAIHFPSGEDTAT